MQHNRNQQGKRSPNCFGTSSSRNLHKNISDSGVGGGTTASSGQDSNQPTKRSTKSRSKVWEKVAWFTRRSKTGKQGKTRFDTAKKENESNCLSAPQLCGACSNKKQNGSVHKTKSFYNLKRRKDRQLKERNCSDFQNIEYSRFPVCQCDTATGTFHDFGADRRLPPGKIRTTSSNSILSEIAREMNCPPKLSAVHSENCKFKGSRVLIPSCSVERKRCKSFSGTIYNSWPRKKRSNVSLSPKDALSPPVKLKRVGIKKTASFNGFDSNIRSTIDDYPRIERFCESTPFLFESNHIKNQSGLEIGVIHFYKSPKCCQENNINKREELAKDICEQKKEKADEASASDVPHSFQGKQLCCEEKGTLQQCMENLHMNDQGILLQTINNSGKAALPSEQLCSIPDTHLSDSSHGCEEMNSFNTDLVVESKNSGKAPRLLITNSSEELPGTISTSSGCVQDSCSNYSFKINSYNDKQILKENKCVSSLNYDKSTCSDQMKENLLTMIVNSISIEQSEKVNEFFTESIDATKGGFCGTESPLKDQLEVSKPDENDSMVSCHFTNNQVIVGDQNRNSSQDCNLNSPVNSYYLNQTSSLNKTDMASFGTTNNCQLRNVDVQNDDAIDYYENHQTRSLLYDDDIISPVIGDCTPAVVTACTAKSEVFSAISAPNDVTDLSEPYMDEVRLEECVCFVDSGPPTLIVHKKEKFREEITDCFDRKVATQVIPMQKEWISNQESNSTAVNKERINTDVSDSNTSGNESEISESDLSLQSLTEKNSPPTNFVEVEKCYLESERSQSTESKCSLILSSINQPSRNHSFDCKSDVISNRTKTVDTSAAACNSHDLHHELQFDHKMAVSQDFNNCKSSKTTVSVHQPTAKRPPPTKVLPPKIDSSLFKQQLELVIQWFQEFNHEQRNTLLRKILEHSELPQMHMLSVAMEPLLHKSCPPNCQDMLAWLPHNVTFRIMSLLDPVSLCHCGQVNRHWNTLASNPILWEQLCSYKDWQLSRPGEQKQMTRYIAPDGSIEWKKMFAERFLLRQNWLKGKCKVRTFEGHSQGISCVQFDDSRIVSGSSDKTIRVWDIHSGDPNAVLTLAGHSGTVRCLNLNGNRLVSGSTDRSIKVWDLSFESYWSGASCKVTMVGHMHTVRCLQVDDDKVVSGSYDKTLKVWSIKTGQCRLTLRGHNAAVLCVQFDEKKIVSGSYDKTIKVWSLSEGSCLMTLTGHHDAVTCLNLTFDGRKVISGSLDHNLKFWDLFTGKCIGTLDWIRSEGHTGVVRCLQADSWRIVSAGDDKTLKVWCLETGQRLLTLRWHTDGVTCLHFNDHRIVSGSYDKTVKLWDFTPVHAFLNLEK